MPLNIEKSGEQDKGKSKEWLVNTDPDGTYLPTLPIFIFSFSLKSESSATSEWLN